MSNSKHYKPTSSAYGHGMQGGNAHLLQQGSFSPNPGLVENRVKNTTSSIAFGDPSGSTLPNSKERTNASYGKDPAPIGQQTSSQHQGNEYIPNASLQGRSKGHHSSTSQGVESWTRTVKLVDPSIGETSPQIQGAASTTNRTGKVDANTINTPRPMTPPVDYNSSKVPIQRGNAHLLQQGSFPPNQGFVQNRLKNTTSSIAFGDQSGNEQIPNASLQGRSKGHYHSSTSLGAESWTRNVKLVDPRIGETSPQIQGAASTTNRTGKVDASTINRPRPVTPPVDYNSPKGLDKTIKRKALGIEGVNNSCYMDSSFVSLFLYDKSFMDVFRKVDQSTSNQVYRPIRDILSNHISLPLNKDKVLENWVMRKFREEMARFNQSYFQDQKDPEEFISTLFGTILGYPPFYRIAGDRDGGYVFQTYGIPNESTKRGTSVQQLVEYSFGDSKIRLAQIPSPGFIIKLPVTDGKHMFPKVFPNLRLSLENVVDKTQFRSNGKGMGMTMGLSAVICLHSNHFTAFVRKDPNLTNLHSHWVYLDSFNHSEYTLISNLSQLLEKEGEEIVQDPLLEILMKNPYMCVYLPLT